MKPIHHMIKLLFILSLFLWAGCGSSGPGTVTYNTVNGHMIAAAEGGEVSCSLEDGTMVSLEIPPGALPESGVVTLKATPNGGSGKSSGETLYSISIEPLALLLYEGAWLSLKFPDSAADRALFCFPDGGGSIPLKQSALSEKTIRGQIYRFGTYNCDRYDEARCAQIADEMVTGSDPTQSWQELLTLFNGLVWTGNRLREYGDAARTIDCMTAAIEFCARDIDAFSEKAVSTVDAAGSAYKNSRTKYQFLQMLCTDRAIGEN